MGKILEVKNLTVHIKTHKGVVQGCARRGFLPE